MEPQQRDGAPGAQVDFSKPLAENVDINLKSHSNLAHTLKLQLPHNNFKKDIFFLLFYKQLCVACTLRGCN